MMSDGAPIVGLLTAELYVSDALTLKDKRSVVKGLLDRLAHRFNVAVAEVGDLDSHHYAVIAITTVANEAAHVQRVLEACRSAIDSESRAVMEDSTLELL